MRSQIESGSTNSAGGTFCLRAVYHQYGRLRHPSKVRPTTPTTKRSVERCFLLVIVILCRRAQIWYNKQKPSCSSIESLQANIIPSRLTVCRKERQTSATMDTTLRRVFVMASQTGFPGNKTRFWNYSSTRGATTSYIHSLYAFTEGSKRKKLSASIATLWCTVRLDNQGFPE